MMVSALGVTIEIVGGYQGGAEPWERTASIRVDQSGFHETHVVGYSGEDRTSIDVSTVAETLLGEFEATSLVNLLAHIARLQTVLKERPEASPPG